LERWRIGCLLDDLTIRQHCDAKIYS